NASVNHHNLAMITQVDACVLRPEVVQRQRNIMLDASSREPLLHFLEARVFTRTQMIHEHTYLDTTASGSIHGREDRLGLFVAARGEIFNVHESLRAIDILGEARTDSVELWEQFDGHAPNHR